MPESVRMELSAYTEKLYAVQRNSLRHHERTLKRLSLHGMLEDLHYCLIKELKRYKIFL